MNLNFTQFVGVINPELDIVLTGVRTWAENQDPDIRVFTWPQLRRIAGISFPKKRNVIKRLLEDGTRNPAHLALCELGGNTASSHVEKFEGQAEEARLNKSARQFVAALTAKGFTVELK